MYNTTKNFYELLAWGKVAEAQVRHYYSKLQGIAKVIDISETEIGKEEDMDILLIYENDKATTLEVKRDSRIQETGNIFV